MYICSLEVLEDFSAASDNHVSTANVIHEEIRLKITCKSALCIPFRNHHHTSIYKKSADQETSPHAHTCARTLYACRTEYFGSRGNRDYAAVKPKRSEDIVRIKYMGSLKVMHKKKFHGLHGDKDRRLFYEYFKLCQQLYYIHNI
jgi:hypothetical protein